MRALKFFLLLLYPIVLFCEPSPRLVCVHIGPMLPSYVEIALDQARLFNPDTPIILIASRQALATFTPREAFELIEYESLPLTAEHKKFIDRTKLNNQILGGYWRSTSERFLYLYDYMAAYEICDLFHIENDVLLYANLADLLPIFQKCYPDKIAAPFETEFKCIPSFFFIPSAKVMQKLAAFFAIKAPLAMLDMKLLALFWKQHPVEICTLPMIMESYLLEQIPEKLKSYLWSTKQRHCDHLAEFNSIFDGAAIGVFLDGLDPAKGDFPPHPIMKDLFDPSKFEYSWELDASGRSIPYISYGSEIYRINNLHIASKRLERFTSKKWPW